MQIWKPKLMVAGTWKQNSLIPRPHGSGLGVGGRGLGTRLHTSKFSESKLVGTPSMARCCWIRFS